MNNDTLEKITTRITITLIIALFPFAFYLISLYSGGYQSKPFFTFILNGVVVLMILLNVLLHYGSIYRSFSKGFLSTYRKSPNNNFQMSLKALAKEYDNLECTIMEAKSAAEQFDKKSKTTSHTEEEDLKDLVENIAQIKDTANKLNEGDTFKAVKVITELKHAIRSVYFNMFLIFMWGLSYSLSVLPKGDIRLVVAAVLTVLGIIALLFKAQYNKTYKSIYSLFI